MLTDDEIRALAERLEKNANRLWVAGLKSHATNSREAADALRSTLDRAVKAEAERDEAPRYFDAIREAQSRQDAEAKLAKAVEALREIANQPNATAGMLRHVAKATLSTIEAGTVEHPDSDFLRRLVENVFSWALNDCNYLDPKDADAIVAETRAGMTPEQAAIWRADRVSVQVEHPDSVRKPAWQDVWPFGCPKNSACARHRQCMYGCAAHKDRPVSDVAAEIDDETKRRTGATNDQ